MGLGKKVLSGAMKIFTSPNTIENGGGLSSLLIPRKASAIGIAVIGAGSIVKDGVSMHNSAKMGRVSYGNGMQRMTNGFTSGAVEAMKEASGGNYAVFSDMAEEVLQDARHRTGTKIENFGATPQMISALYNMKGR